MVKNPPAMWKSWVQFLGWEDPREIGVATVSLILFMAPIVLLFTLSAPFLEPRVGKARAKRVEEEARSHWSCRCIFFSPSWQGSHHRASLLAKAAAIAAATT